MKTRILLETWNRFHARTAVLPESQLPKAPAANFPILGRLNSSQAAIGLALGYLWFCVIASLKYEWTTDPRSSYGWVVPVLCLGLLVRRWRGVRDGAHPLSDLGPPQHSKDYPILIAAGTLAALYLPIRLLEGAVPEWRPLQSGSRSAGRGTDALCHRAGQRPWLGSAVGLSYLLFLDCRAVAHACRESDH